MKSIFLALVLFASPLLAIADVNRQAGNPSITDKDIAITRDGRSLEMARTYNPKATGAGWFGNGWGSKFETQLILLPDGSAVIQENGNGRTSYYRRHDEEAVRRGLQRIVAVAREQDKLSKAESQILAAKLQEDEELRLSLTIKYNISTEWMEGYELDDACGQATLFRVPEGYVRLDCNRFGDSESATDTFDSGGHLFSHALADGYSVSVDYASYSDYRRHAVSVIRDTLGQTLELTRTPDGYVTSAMAGDKWSRYEYRDGELVRAELSDGKNYRYAYDSQRNLTRPTDVDGSSILAPAQADPTAQQTQSR